MHKKVTISLPPELNERWNKVAVKHGLVKSVMVQNYLNTILLKLENEEPHRYVENIVKEIYQDRKEKSLFEDAKVS